MKMERDEQGEEERKGATPLFPRRKSRPLYRSTCMRGLSTWSIPSSSQCESILSQRTNASGQTVSARSATKTFGRHEAQFHVCLSVN